MKRSICLIMVLCFMLSGCSVVGERIKEPVAFYYVSDTYQEDMAQVIVSEVREASGHRDDLSYLLALYSMGPITEELKTPLPRNSNITVVDHSENSLELDLTDGSPEMTDANFTLASACIAKTCMELTDVQQITVHSGDRRITIQHDNLLLDHSMSQNTQEETT